MQPASRSISASCILAAFVLAAACAPQLAQAQETGTAHGPTVSVGRANLKVLFIGDSLSVGGFGDALADDFNARFGRANFAMYAACGSSPEHWLRGRADYVARCGYREITPRSNLHYDYHNGHRPTPAPAPKVEDLITLWHPRTVMIQLGTNWMDAMTEHPNATAHYYDIVYKFINAIRSEPGTVRQIIWISPPDSSHYLRSIQTSVLNILVQSGKKYGFTVVDSTQLTHYTPRSGGDGIHYNDAEGRAWAASVWRDVGPAVGR